MRRPTTASSQTVWRKAAEALRRSTTAAPTASRSTVLFTAASRRTIHHCLSRESDIVGAPFPCLFDERGQPCQLLLGRASLGFGQQRGDGAFDAAAEEWRGLRDGPLDSWARAGLVDAAVGGAGELGAALEDLAAHVADRDLAGALAEERGQIERLMGEADEVRGYLDRQQQAANVEGLYGA